MSDGFGEEVEEVEDQVDEEDDKSRRAGHPQLKKMRQITLDAFLGCPSTAVRSPCSFLTSRPRTKGTPAERRSISVTTTIVEASDAMKLSGGGALQRRSMAVVEEVNQNASSSFTEQEIRRMSATIQKAKEKYGKGTLDAYFSRKMAKFSSISVDESVMPSTSSVDEEPDLEPFRCYAEPYPDLNDKGVADIVLISIGSIRPNVLPKPYPPICIDPVLGWNRGRSCVRLPFSSLNLIDGRPHFRLIRDGLEKLTLPLKSAYQIKECIESYTRRKWQFDALDKFFASIPEQLCEEYLTTVIPFMATLALSAPDLITQPLPILRRGREGSVTISQQQAAALLALAFFCTFPCRGSRNTELPLINFNRLFDPRTDKCIEKLKCIMHYFHQISVQMPSGVLTYRRQQVSPPSDWRKICMPLTRLAVSSTATIEDDGYGMLQVDFANQYIGGGVLGSGCVQEEIRFLICPEMMVSMLLCERMDHNESIVILGAQRYSDYEGYGHTFQWCPLHSPDSLSRDRFERLRCEVVAIDALPFTKPHHQFNVDLVDRELLKAYCGFSMRDGSSKAVATGNWGCGVFGGDVRLKSVIQIIAASMQARPLCYFAFGKHQFANRLRTFYGELRRRNVTTCQLYDLVAMYCMEEDKETLDLFDFILHKLRTVSLK
uniref:poly(ADP-ribose) glycohydrolase n=1 Tax=Ascaris suum TaxID=6253 RepID=F1KZ17_ASCSU